MINPRPKTESSEVTLVFWLCLEHFSNSPKSLSHSWTNHEFLLVFGQRGLAAKSKDRARVNDLSSNCLTIYQWNSKIGSTLFSKFTKVGHGRHSLCSDVVTLRRSLHNDVFCLYLIWWKLVIMFGLPYSQEF